jgi:hypothetical protein
MTRSDLTHRLHAFTRGQLYAGVLGALPLLGLYFVIHTPLLKPYVQDHKHLMALLLVTAPLAWLFGVTLAWKQLAPRWLGLECPACRGSLAPLASTRGPKSDHCPACGAVVVDADPARD